MNPLRRQEKERLFAFCLGLTRVEETACVAGWIARQEQAAGLGGQIQAPLGPLESLPPGPCPEELAERTVQLLCAAARESSEMAHTKTPRRRSYDREDLWLCLSNNILMK